MTTKKRGEEILRGMGYRQDLRRVQGRRMGCVVDWRAPTGLPNLYWDGRWFDHKANVVKDLDAYIAAQRRRDDKHRALRPFIARRRNGAWHVHVDGGYGRHTDFRAAYLRATWGL